MAPRRGQRRTSRRTPECNDDGRGKSASPTRSSKYNSTFSFLSVARPCPTKTSSPRFFAAPARPPLCVFEWVACNARGGSNIVCVCEWGRRLSVITFELCVCGSLCAARERRGITFNPPNVVYLSAIMETVCTYFIAALGHQDGVWLVKRGGAAAEGVKIDY